MKKVITTVIITIILIFSFLTLANATENQSMKISIKPNNKSYKVGDEILIDVYIDEIKGFSGINTFVAEKKYDSEILEYIDTVTIGDNWEVVGDDINIVLREKSGNDLEKGKLCTLRFKSLKETENTQIQLDKVDACNDDGDVYYEDGNVNSPQTQITVTNTKKQGKSYVGIMLITGGFLGLLAVGTHYIINKNKNI